MVAMMPIMYAYDRIHYAPGLRVYIRKEDAHEVHRKFSEGSFSSNRTGNSFAGASIDHALEQTLNRGSKTDGGIIDISNNEAGCTKWFSLGDRSDTTMFIENAYTEQT